MPYPFWDVGVGYGILMAIFAVVHVFVSHFAIGGGLYLVSPRAPRGRRATNSASSSYAGSASSSSSPRSYSAR